MKEVAYADIASLVGQEIGVSDWVEISQERVNQFAEATGDHQWIHCLLYTSPSPRDS